METSIPTVMILRPSFSLSLHAVAQATWQSLLEQRGTPFQSMRRCGLSLRLMVDIGSRIADNDMAYTDFMDTFALVEVKHPPPVRSCTHQLRMHRSTWIANSSRTQAGSFTLERGSPSRYGECFIPRAHDPNEQHRALGINMDGHKCALGEVDREPLRGSKHVQDELESTHLGLLRWEKDKSVVRLFGDRTWKVIHQGVPKHNRVV